MNTLKQLKISKLAMAFFLVAFVLFTSSTSVLAAVTQTFNNKGQVESQLLIEDGLNNFISPKEREKLLDPAQIPAQRQPSIDRTDPDSKLLEKIVQMFKDVTKSTSK